MIIPPHLNVAMSSQDEASVAPATLCDQTRATSSPSPDSDCMVVSASTETAADRFTTTEILPSDHGPAACSSSQAAGDGGGIADKYLTAGDTDAEFPSSSVGDGGSSGVEQELSNAHSSADGTARAQFGEVLVCAMCSSKLQHCDQCPRMLTACLHTVCEVCAELFDDSDDIECKRCHTHSPNTVPHTLALSLLRRWRRPSGQRQRLCGQCQERGATVPACVACCECRTDLCGDCEQAHQRTRATWDHRIECFQDLHTDETRCKQHHKFYDNFCDTCGVVCCVECILSSHRSHVSCTLETKATQLRAKIVDSSRRIKALHKKTTEIQMAGKEKLVQAFENKKATVDRITAHYSRYQEMVRSFFQRQRDFAEDKCDMHIQAMHQSSTDATLCEAKLHHAALLAELLVDEEQPLLVLNNAKYISDFVGLSEGVKLSVPSSSAPNIDMRRIMDVDRIGNMMSDLLYDGNTCMQPEYKRRLTHSLFALWHQALVNIHKRNPNEINTYLHPLFQEILKSSSISCNLYETVHWFHKELVQRFGLPVVPQTRHVQAHQQSVVSVPNSVCSVTPLPSARGTSIAAERRASTALPDNRSQAMRSNCLIDVMSFESSDNGAHEHLAVSGSRLDHHLTHHGVNTANSTSTVQPPPLVNAAWAEPPSQIPLRTRSMDRRGGRQVPPRYPGRLPHSNDPVINTRAHSNAGQSLQVIPQRTSQCSSFVVPQPVSRTVQPQSVDFIPTTHSQSNFNTHSSQYSAVATPSLVPAGQDSRMSSMGTQLGMPSLKELTSMPTSKQTQSPNCGIQSQSTQRKLTLHSMLSNPTSAVSDFSGLSSSAAVDVVQSTSASSLFTRTGETSSLSDSFSWHNPLTPRPRRSGEIDVAPKFKIRVGVKRIYEDTLDEFNTDADEHTETKVDEPTESNNATMQSVGKHTGETEVDGPTESNNATMQSVGKHTGETEVDGPTESNNATMQSVGEHTGEAEVDGPTESNNATMQSVGKHTGETEVDGPTESNNATMQSVGEHTGEAEVDGPTESNNAIMQSVGKHTGETEVDGPTESNNATMQSVREQSDEAEVDESTESNNATVQRVGGQIGETEVDAPTESNNYIMQSVGEQVRDTELGESTESNNVTMQSVGEPIDDTRGRSSPEANSQKVRTEGQTDLIFNAQYSPVSSDESFVQNEERDSSRLLNLPEDDVALKPQNVDGSNDKSETTLSDSVACLEMMSTPKANSVLSPGNSSMSRSELQISSSFTLSTMSKQCDISCAMTASERHPKDLLADLDRLLDGIDVPAGSNSVDVNAATSAVDAAANSPSSSSSDMSNRLVIDVDNLDTSLSSYSSCSTCVNHSRHNIKVGAHMPELSLLSGESTEPTKVLPDTTGSYTQENAGVSGELHNYTQIVSSGASKNGNVALASNAQESDTSQVVTYVDASSADQGRRSEIAPISTSKASTSQAHIDDSSSTGDTCNCSLPVRSSNAEQRRNAIISSESLSSEEGTISIDQQTISGEQRSTEIGCASKNLKNSSLASKLSRSGSDVNCHRSSSQRRHSADEYIGQSRVVPSSFRVRSKSGNAPSSKSLQRHSLPVSKTLALSGSMSRIQTNTMCESTSQANRKRTARMSFQSALEMSDIRSSKISKSGATRKTHTDLFNDSTKNIGRNSHGQYTPVLSRTTTCSGGVPGQTGRGSSCSGGVPGQTGRDSSCSAKNNSTRKAAGPSSAYRRVGAFSPVPMNAVKPARFLLNRPRERQGGPLHKMAPQRSRVSSNLKKSFRRSGASYVVMERGAKDVTSNQATDHRCKTSEENISGVSPDEVVASDVCHPGKTSDSIADESASKSRAYMPGKSGVSAKKSRERVSAVRRDSNNSQMSPRNQSPEIIRSSNSTRDILGVSDKFSQKSDSNNKHLRYTVHKTTLSQRLKKRDAKTHISCKEGSSSPVGTSRESPDGCSISNSNQTRTTAQRDVPCGHLKKTFKFFSRGGKKPNKTQTKSIKVCDSNHPMTDDRSTNTRNVSPPKDYSSTESCPFGVSKQSKRKRLRICSSDEDDGVEESVPTSFALSPATPPLVNSQSISDSTYSKSLLPVHIVRLPPGGRDDLQWDEKADPLGIGLNSSFLYQPPERRCSSPNTSYCEFCWDGGNLVLCDMCTKSYHEGCYFVPIVDNGDKWQCLMCSEIERPRKPSALSASHRAINSTEKLLLIRLLMELYSQYYASLYFRDMATMNKLPEFRVKPGLISLNCVRDRVMSGSFKSLLHALRTLKKLMSQKKYLQKNKTVCGKLCELDQKFEEFVGLHMSDYWMLLDDH